MTMSVQYVLSLALVFWVATSIIDWLGMKEPIGVIIKIVIGVVTLLLLGAAAYHW